MNLKSSSKQANLLIVGCVGFFLFCLCLVLVQGRELKWAKHVKQPGILVHYILISV